MNRRSIAGPLVLIGIGAIFLINNMRPDVIAWSQIGKFWPFLLIVFGLVRLFEVLIDAGRGRPLPARSSRGGAGIVALLLLCAVAWAASRPNGPFRSGHWRTGGIEFFGEEFTYPAAAHAAAAGTSTLAFENLRGNLSITGSDGDDIQVEGTRMIRAYSKTSSDKADRARPVELVRDGDRIVLRTNEAPSDIDRRVSIDLRIKVPRRMNLQARILSGDMTFSAIDGTVNVSGNRGDVRMNDIGGNTKVELSRGGLVRAMNMRGSLDLQGRGDDLQLENVAGQVTINGYYSGTLEFKNVTKPLHFESPHTNTEVRVEQIPGNITMDLGDLRANGLVGPVRVVARSRDVQIENFTDSLEVDIERGDIQLKPGRVPLPKMDVHARSGNIQLSLPEGAEFDLRASTAHGEARNDYGDALRLENEGRSASLKSVSGRGPVITASTDRGTIGITKGEFTAMPARHQRMGHAGGDPSDRVKDRLEEVRRRLEDARRQADESRR
ncbi:MAG: DUF4097 family beta strand repeat-containing protein [Acidobacteriota bacterium]|nr:DUF4097 family beta strand repeat-containing protein [Acidobacteriota bacterium]